MMRERLLAQLRKTTGFNYIGESTVKSRRRFHDGCVDKEIS